MRTPIQARQPAGIPTGGQFASTARAEPATALTGDCDATYCSECGQEAVLEPDGTTHHLTPTGAVDLESDSDHTVRTPRANPADGPTPEVDEDLADAVEAAEAEVARAHAEWVGWREDEARAYLTGTREEKAETRTQLAASKETLDRAKSDLEIARMAADPTRNRPLYIDFARPRNVSQLRKALADLRAGRVPGVALTGEALERFPFKEPVTVRGPKDGSPAFIDIESGFHPVEIAGGTAVVFAGSQWGNAIHVTGTGTAIVHAEPGAKVSTHADGPSARAIVVGQPDAHGLQVREGGAQLDVYGDAENLRTLTKPAQEAS